MNELLGIVAGVSIYLFMAAGTFFVLCLVERRSTPDERCGLYICTFISLAWMLTLAISILYYLCAGAAVVLGRIYARVVFAGEK